MIDTFDKMFISAPVNFLNFEHHKRPWSTNAKVVSAVASAAIYAFVFSTQNLTRAVITAVVLQATNHLFTTYFPGQGDESKKPKLGGSKAKVEAEKKAQAEKKLADEIAVEKLPALAAKVEAEKKLAALAAKVEAEKKLAAAIAQVNDEIIKTGYSTIDKSLEAIIALCNTFIKPVDMYTEDLKTFIVKTNTERDKDIAALQPDQKEAGEPLLKTKAEEKIKEARDAFENNAKIHALITQQKAKAEEDKELFARNVRL